MRIWHHLEPALPPAHGPEPLRAGLGALLGLGLCAALAGFSHAQGYALLTLLAPLGATAVLLFCVPNSPLAQPWSAIVGNSSAALVALGVVHLVPGSWAIGVAVGAAITVMILLRALHPPGGAVALLTALDPAAALAAGPFYALVPLTLSTLVLVLCATAYNRATGRVYPFRLPPEAPPVPTPRLGLTTEQLGALLERFNQATNLGIADLGRLLAAAEAEGARHRFAGTTCADIMTTPLVTTGLDTPLPQAARLLRRHRVQSLPVVTAEGHLAGLLSQADLLPLIAAQDRPLPRVPRAARRRVAEVMQTGAETVPHDLPVGALLNRLADAGSDVVPVLRAGRLAGLITRSDILRLLLQGAEERPPA